MHDFTVLVLPDAFASGVAQTLDMLSTAASVAPSIGCAAPTWRVLGCGAQEMSLGQGLTLGSIRPLPRRQQADASIWIVPGLGTATAEALHERLNRDDAKAAMRALRRHADAGGQIAASCSAVFLLQAAGLLAGRTVTTTWWLAPLLQRAEPRCQVDANRMVVCDGPLTTAGAAFAQVDLMLRLLQGRFSPGLADAVSRVLLVEGRESQAPFMLPALLARGDALISRLVARLEASLPTPPSIAALAAEFHMSERTLARQVRAATGRSTSTLLQGIRLNKARALLQSSRHTVEQIAELVGYTDTTALRRLMRKTVGLTPRQLRHASSPGR